VEHRTKEVSSESDSNLDQSILIFLQSVRHASFDLDSRTREEKGVCTRTDLVGTMMTRIFHPNVSKAGEICVDTLKKSWNKKYGVGHVLVVSPPSLLCQEMPRAASAGGSQRDQGIGRCR
jgi:hypothetical protein